MEIPQEGLVIYPDFDYIVRKTKGVIFTNAVEKEKGNSWLKIAASDPFWAGKLDEETKEVEKASSAEEMEKELLDVIAVCAFRIQNIREGNF